MAQRYGTEFRNEAVHPIRSTLESNNGSFDTCGIMPLTNPAGTRQALET